MPAAIVARAVLERAVRAVVVCGATRAAGIWPGDPTPQPSLDEPDA